VESDASWTKCATGAALSGIQLCGLPVWLVQELLKLVDELRYMQAVCQPMVHMDGYRHGAPAGGLSDLAEGDSRRRIFMGEVSRVRDGSEVEPWQRRIANQVGVFGAFQFIPLPHPLHFDGSLAHEFSDTFAIRIMSESDGTVWASHCATAINHFIAPDRAIHDARMKVLNLLRGDERTMQE
jgi:hypothetical protein